MIIAPNDNADPWQLNPGERGAKQPTLRFESLKGIYPLDAQLGVSFKENVPNNLYGTMFGQPSPSPAEVAAEGGDPASVPRMRTYAILDAAKVPNLPELLECSGLAHRCLFKGAAYDELKDVAPWIVQLEDSNIFTRNLFTQSDAERHLWDVEPGIYVRSRGTLNEMWQHFRKFTRGQDRRGNWYYIRFYDPDYLSAYLTVMDVEKLSKFMRGVSSFVTVVDGEVHVMSMSR